MYVSSNLRSVKTPPLSPFLSFSGARKWQSHGFLSPRTNSLYGSIWSVGLKIIEPGCQKLNTGWLDTPPGAEHLVPPLIESPEAHTAFPLHKNGVHTAVTKTWEIWKYKRTHACNRKNHVMPQVLVLSPGSSASACIHFWSASPDVVLVWRDVQEVLKKDKEVGNAFAANTG